MKKRVLSLLLAIVMVLGLFPITAFAAEENTEAESVLKMHMICSDPNKTWEEEYTDVSCQVFGWIEMWAVLHHADGSTELISPEDLSFPSFVDFKIVDEKTGCFELRMDKLGDGKIRYTVGETTYAVGLHSVVPDLGLYRDVPYDAAGKFDSSSLMENVILQEGDETFYIALSPEYAGSLHMSRVSTKFDSYVTGTNLLKVGTIELSQDGSYAKVTITDPEAEGHHHFEVTLLNNDGNEGGRWGRSIHIENDMPRLYYCNVNQNRDEVTVNWKDSHSDWYMVPGQTWHVCFYYGSRSAIRAGKVDALSPDQLKFPAWMTAKLWEERDLDIPENTVELKVTRFANAADAAGITYEMQDGTALISAKTGLPEIGFYSSPVASEEGFLYLGNPFVQTETNDTLYVCTKPDSEIRNLRFVSWRNEEYAPVFDVKASQDGSYLIVTVKKGQVVPTGALNMMVEYEQLHHDRWELNEHNFMADAESTIPTLMYRWLQWDEEKETFFEDETMRLASRLQMRSGNSTVVQFYYGTAKNMIPVDLSDLLLPEDLVEIEKQDDFDRLRAVGYEGVGMISYPDPDTGEILAQMEIAIDKPEYGLYCDEIATEENYLWYEVVLEDADDAFYVLIDDDRKIENLRVLRNWQEDMSSHFTIQLSPDGMSAEIRMTGESLPAGGQYQVELSTKGNDRRHLNFMLVRGDLPQLSTPTDLSWHREYHWDNDSADDYDVRMGSMSFRFGDLAQNRIAVEIYEVVNGKDMRVDDSGWTFGDTNHSSYFSVSDFIYGQFESGTYRFRIKALGDGVKYRDSEWSELSEAWTYTKPAAKLAPPDASTFRWEKVDGRFMAYWKVPVQEGQERYEIRWLHEDAKTGNLEDNAGNFDNRIYFTDEDGFFHEPINDDVLERFGTVNYYFKVRMIPQDITKYQISDYSGLSPALDIQTIADKVNQVLDALIPDDPTDPKPTLEDVQKALENSTAELREAMTADQSISGGPSSGTLERIQELEDAVADNVEQKVEVHDKANKEIAAIANDITMVGAALNWESKNGNDNNSVTLVVDEPKKGIVIPEQQHNAIQFSLKLKGAVNEYVEEGQRLAVPIVINIPVPEKINPDFLVILHLLADGTIEQLRPYIYWEETEKRYRATFVIDSFSDFAMLEYDVSFEASELTKTLGEKAFINPVIGAPEGAGIAYQSSHPEVAEVDPQTGEVTMLSAGETIITAVIAATEIYPEQAVSYTLIVVEAEEKPQPPRPDFPGSGAPVVTPKPEPTPAPDVENEESEEQPEPAPMVNPFTDIAEDAYYYDAVLWAVDKGITAGVGDGTVFDPDAACTRAQMAVFLWRAAGCPEPQSDAAVFADVELGAYYAKAVQWAVETGITLGTSDTTFSPDVPCTRAQMACFLYRYEQAQGGGFTGAWMFRLPFTDVPDWAFEAIAWCYMNGITGGTSDTTFSPDAPCTRAQLAAFLYRFLAK